MCLFLKSDFWQTYLKYVIVALFLFFLWRVVEVKLSLNELRCWEHKENLVLRREEVSLETAFLGTELKSFAFNMEMRWS